jgi:hypothetical protein
MNVLHLRVYDGLIILHHHQKAIVDSSILRKESMDVFPRELSQAGMVDQDEGNGFEGVKHET